MVTTRFPPQAEWVASNDPAAASHLKVELQPGMSSPLEFALQRAVREPPLPDAP